jgi:hypothetical protein
MTWKDHLINVIGTILLFAVWSSAVWPLYVQFTIIGFSIVYIIQVALYYRFKDY